VNFAVENNKDRRGLRTILTLEEDVLVALEYWQQYRTYFGIFFCKGQRKTIDIVMQSPFFF